MRRKAEAAGHQLCLDLGCGERGDQRAALQTFFESPGRVGFILDHHDEKKSRVETESHEPRSVRTSPFPRGMPCQAPQNEVAGRVRRRRLLGDDGEGESKRGRLIAVGLRLDLMQPAALQLVEEVGGVILRGSALCASHLQMPFRDLNAVILRWRPKGALEG